MIDRSEASTLLARAIANHNVGKAEVAAQAVRDLVALLRDAGIPVDGDQ